MADRILKSDSGNDTVIQNNSGSRKIEVTNSGDVEVTGDFKATTVKATNLKANDGTAGLVVADSTGRVTANEKISTDDIIEKTSTHGVEIDGVLLKDGALDTGAISDSVTMSNKFWASWAIDADTPLSADTNVNAYFDGSTTGTDQFYINWDSGVDANDTTSASGNNFYQGAATNKLKIVQAGVYFLAWNTNFFGATSGKTRYITSQIQDASSTVLAASTGQLADTDSGSSTDFANITTNLCKHFTANSEIKLMLYSTTAVSLHVTSRFSIVLIRPT